MYKFTKDLARCIRRSIEWRINLWKLEFAINRAFMPLRWGIRCLIIKNQAQQVWVKTCIALCPER